MALAVATSASSVASAATTIAATQPSGIADGDILLAFVAKNTITAPSTVPSGWTLGVASPYISNTNGTGTPISGNVGTGWCGVYWKIASAESGAYTLGSTSASWNVQILRLTGFRAPKPGGSVVAPILFMDAEVNARTLTTITPTNGMHAANVWSDGVLMISQFVQTVVGATATFSALSGTMTSVANSNQTGVSQQVAWEYIDMTVNPNFGKRQVTTNQSTGNTSGWCLMLPDPSAITGRKIDQRNLLRPRTS